MAAEGPQCGAGVARVIGGAQGHDCSSFKYPCHGAGASRGVPAEGACSGALSPGAAPPGPVGFALVPGP